MVRIKALFCRLINAIINKIKCSNDSCNCDNNTDFQPIKNWSLSDDRFDFLNFQIIIDVGIYKLKKC